MVSHKELWLFTAKMLSEYLYIRCCFIFVTCDTSVVPCLHFLGYAMPLQRGRGREERNQYLAGRPLRESRAVCCCCCCTLLPIPGNNFVTYRLTGQPANNDKVNRSDDTHIADVLDKPLTIAFRSLLYTLHLLSVNELENTVELL